MPDVFGRTMDDGIFFNSFKVFEYKLAIVDAKEKMTVDLKRRVYTIPAM